MKVLFVCTGNICRSPIAHRMLERLNQERDLGLEVSSAGTRALNGKPMHPESRRVLEARGFEPGDFSSRLLTPPIVGAADLVLGLTREHRAVARQLVPIRWKRMFALRELSSGSAGSAGLSKDSMGHPQAPTDQTLDIEDPIGRDSEYFDVVAGEIENAVIGLARWIEESSVVQPARHGKHSDPRENYAN